MPFFIKIYAQTCVNINPKMILMIDRNQNSYYIIFVISYHYYYYNYIRYYGL